MNAWVFRVFPHERTPYDRFKEVDVIADGKPSTNKDNQAGWKYPMHPEQMWSKETPAPKKNPSPNAKLSLERLLCRLKAGDLILAMCGEHKNPFTVLGIGKLGDNPEYNYRRQNDDGSDFPTTRKQPHTLGPVVWIDRPLGPGVLESVSANLFRSPFDCGLKPAEDLTRQIAEAWIEWGGDAEPGSVEKPQTTREEDSMEKEILGLLRDARQLILHGPPGTGKTYTARRVAARLLGSTWPADEAAASETLDARKNDQRFNLVVFHPSYEYDQFIGGLTVDVTEGQQELRYRVHTGPLLAMCQHAAEHPGDDHVLVIDEINRGNLSKLLGELLHALEYRNEKVTLPFQSKPLVVPKNLYVIATMNSSDRSIGHIDVATRRRFALFRVPPVSDVVRSEWRGQWGDAESGEGLAGAMERINLKLKEDGKEEDLGVGQSYFLPYPGSDAEHASASVLRKINHSLLPLLQEYDKMIGHTGDACLAPEKEFDDLAAVFAGWSA